MSAPTLELALQRFGDDLAAAAERQTFRRPVVRRRRVMVAMAAVAVLAVPGAFGAYAPLFGGLNHAQHPAPPGFEIPVTGPSPVEVGRGTLATGVWRAFAIRCDYASGAQSVAIAVVAPAGAAGGGCAPAPAAGPPVSTLQPPGEFYDGQSESTFVYGAVAGDVASVELQVGGSSKSVEVVEPERLPDTVARGWSFFVVNVPGDRAVTSMVPRDSGGAALGRCDERRCTAGEAP